MTTSPLTVGAVFRAHAAEFLAQHENSIPAHQKRALRAISFCRTEYLGGHVLQCKECQRKVEHYNSCYTRGCPQCEGSKEAKWLLERESELLPTHYYHVVFTLPHVFNELILHNQRVCYKLFFQSAAKTLITVAKKKFKGKLGFFAVLHTWGQLLELHPHLHCVIPGGVVRADGSWVPTNKKGRYLLPEKVLLRVFQGIFLQALRRSHASKKLSYAGDLEALITEATKRRWSMHTEPPFGSALDVLKYLSRYTRKVAISNSRLISLEHGMVTFTWKDYANGGAMKTCSMNAVEFMRRVLMHIPLPGFVRIRHYGFMAGKGRKERIASLKEQISSLLPILVNHPKTDDSFKPGLCPYCKTAALVVVGEIAPTRHRSDSS